MREVEGAYHVERKVELAVALSVEIVVQRANGSISIGISLRVADRIEVSRVVCGEEFLIREVHQNHKIAVLTRYHSAVRRIACSCRSLLYAIKLAEGGHESAHGLNAVLRTCSSKIALVGSTGCSLMSQHTAGCHAEAHTISIFIATLHLYNRHVVACDEVM